MFAGDMKEYQYRLYSGVDEYGQQTAPAEVVGTIKAAIYERSKTMQDSALYLDAEYIAITGNKLPSSMVINYEGQALKVLYSMTRGSFKQSFLQRTGGAF